MKPELISIFLTTGVPRLLYQLILTVIILIMTEGMKSCRKSSFQDVTRVSTIGYVILVSIHDYNIIILLQVEEKSLFISYCLLLIRWYTMSSSRNNVFFSISYIQQQYYFYFPVGLIIPNEHENFYHIYLNKSRFERCLII